MSGVDVAIVGGGISGLSALHFVRTLKPELTTTLFEADDRLGGTIGTDHLDGYSLDWGPNGFLDREPLTLRLCEELGLKDRLEKANQNVSNRYILRKGKLRNVPMSPPAFMMSDILTVGGKLRLLKEPWAKPRQNGIDESIYDFACRRIGRAAADYLVQPMVSGVYGGLADRLSLKSCFPIMREMEDEHGSLFKAMIAKARKARAAGKKSGGPAGPGGWLTSFKGGLYVIIERFEQKYAMNIRRGMEVRQISRNGDNYDLMFADGSAVSAKNLIIAAPSNAAGKIVRPLSDRLSVALGEIPYAPISVICLGYARDRITHDLQGFGFLVPQLERRRILGSIWTSSIFSDRAPEGMVQFRTMIGGDGDHESADLSDDALVELATSDLRQIVGISGEPSLVKLYRWRHGIPQFRIGHSETIARIEAELNKLPGLHLTGNAYHGIGLNDCVKQSYKVVNQI